MPILKMVEIGHAQPIEKSIEKACPTDLPKSTKIHPALSTYWNLFSYGLLYWPVEVCWNGAERRQQQCDGVQLQEEPIDQNLIESKLIERKQPENKLKAIKIKTVNIK